MRTVAGANKIVVSNNGTVAQQGAPDVLMKQGGIFREMAELQNKAQNCSIA